MQSIAVNDSSKVEIFVCSFCFVQENKTTNRKHDEEARLQEQTLGTLFISVSALSRKQLLLAADAGPQK